MASSRATAAPEAGRTEVGYTHPLVSPLSRVRIVDRFPWGGPPFDFLGLYATVVGMEARLAPLSDGKYGNDGWDYKLEVEGRTMPPVWLPSSCFEIC